MNRQPTSLTAPATTAYAPRQQATEEDEMAVFLGAFPVLPGKEDEPAKFARETLDRREELDASQGRMSISSEEWALQQTPMGAMVIVRFESSDVPAAFARLAESDDAFDVWFRERVFEITGVDLAAPSDDPLPEVIFSWSAG